MAVMCQLHRILALILLSFCAVKACSITIVCSNSLIGFTIQRYVNESNADFDSDSDLWTIASTPCNNNSASKLTLTCVKNFTLQDAEKRKLINGSGEKFWQCGSVMSLKPNIFGCQRVRANL
jgi:hypothetical protein